MFQVAFPGEKALLAPAEDVIVLGPRGETPPNHCRIQFVDCTLQCRLIGFLMTAGSSPLWMRMVMEFFQLAGIFLYLLQVSRILVMIEEVGSIPLQ